MLLRTLIGAPGVSGANSGGCQGHGKVMQHPRMSAEPDGAYFCSISVGEIFIILVCTHLESQLENEAKVYCVSLHDTPFVAQ